jgi:hypothetical protein
MANVGYCPEWAKLEKEFESMDENTPKSQAIEWTKRRLTHLAECPPCSKQHSADVAKRQEEKMGGKPEWCC